MSRRSPRRRRHRPAARQFQPDSARARVASGGRAAGRHASLRAPGSPLRRRAPASRHPAPWTPRGRRPPRWPAPARRAARRHLSAIPRRDSRARSCSRHGRAELNRARANTSCLRWGRARDRPAPGSRRRRLRYSRSKWSTGRLRGSRPVKITWRRRARVTATLKRLSLLRKVTVLRCEDGSAQKLMSITSRSSPWKVCAVPQMMSWSCSVFDLSLAASVRFR